MSHTIKDFLKYEQNEMHINIDRIKHGLKGEDPNNPRLAGSHTILELQEAHLKFIEELSSRVSSYDEAIHLCREQIIQNEFAHQQVALVESHQATTHSSEWWYTLQQIQFYTDFLNRIKTWQKAYA